MNHKKVMSIKRIIAWMLIVCMVLSNSSFTKMNVMATSTTPSTISCTIKPTVKVGGTSYVIPASYIKVQDGSGNTIAISSDNKCDLIPESAYKCVISGKEMDEHTVGFTAPKEAGDVGIVGDATKIKLVYSDLDSFEVGDSITPENDLNISWTWSTSDAKIATVDESGMVTGISGGAVTITRTSSKASATDVATSNSVTINVINESEYTLNYKFGNQPLLGDTKPNIVIKDANGIEIKPDESSKKYTFIWGETYSYDLIEANGVKNPTSGRTFVPRQNNTMVDIKVDLEVPVFKVEGKDISTTKIKKDEENIPITCDNINSLYDASNWKIKIPASNNYEKIVSDKDIVIDTNSVKTIDYYYGTEKAKTFSIQRFDDYTVSYYYSGQKLNLDTVKFTGDKEVSEFEANKQYYLESVVEPGFTYNQPNPNPYVVATSYTNNDYRIDIASADVQIATPTIYVGSENTTMIKEGLYEVTYGETLTIKLDNYQSYLDGGRSNWKLVCQSDNGSITAGTPNVTDSTLTYTITMKGNTDGTYKIKYQYGDGSICSNVIEVQVKKIKLNVKDNKLPAITKVYDANGKFTYKLKANAGYFVDENGNGVTYNEDITIDCKVDGVDTGEYDKIEIIDAKAGQVFDVSALKGKECAVNTASITKANVTLSIDELYLYYMDETGDAVKSIFKEPTIYPEGVNDSLKQVIFDYLGKINVTDREEQTYTIADAKKKIQLGEHKNASGTIVYNIEGTIEPKATEFKYSPQVLDSTRNMQNYIGISQEQFGKSKIVGNKEWINSNNLQIGFAELEDGNQYTTYYDTIGYAELDYIENDGTVNTAFGNKYVASRSFSPECSEDKYYGIVISKEGNYKTIALIVRVVAEKNKDNTYESTITGTNGITYSVVNLYLDATGDTVTYEEPLDGYNTESKDFNYANVELKQAYKNESDKVSFTVSGDVSPVKSIQYTFKKVSGNGVTNQDAPGVTEWLSGTANAGAQTLEWGTKDADSSNSLVLEDGNYVLFVKVVDKVGNESVYVSKGFVVDSKPPVLHFYIDGEEKTVADVKDGICEQAINEIKFELVETNLDPDSVQVTVSVQDKKGQPIGNIDADEATNTLCTEQKWNKRDLIDGNYEIHISATDENGKSIVDDEGTPIDGIYKFTKDGIAPEEGTITVEGYLKEVKSDKKEKGIIDVVATSFVRTWNGVVDQLYTVFANDEVKVKLSATDRISDVTIWYAITDQSYNTDESIRNNKTIEWKEYTGSAISVKSSQKEYVYMKASDKAGNTSFFNSQGIITDVEKPVINAKVTRPTETRKGFYNDTVKIAVDVKDITGSNQTGMSGLQYVGYRVESNGEVTENNTIINNIIDSEKDNKVDIISDKEFTIEIDGEKHNKNDVTVYIDAVDNAGNKADQVKMDLQIDTTNPTINIEFNDQEGAEYYNQTRTATITITERNLDYKDVDITIKSKHGSKASIGKWDTQENTDNPDKTINTCVVRFDADDDYEFYVDCVDKAGNKAKTSEKHVFTVDKTNPIIDVSYSDGQVQENGYYNKTITAMITITEHNFDASKANIDITQSDGSNIGASSFSSNGDKHTASVVFNHDGTYSLDVTFTDEAGNKANDYTGNTFHVDLKDPVVEITNVKDKSANKDDVNPIITCTDENYDENKVSISVKGANTGEISLDKLGVSSKAIANGEEFTLTFPKQEAMDDIYTLTAKMEDKAGNETEDSIQFSVNRYGSVYTLGTETGEWLTDGVCSYIKEGRKVVIIETNVDEVVERNIAYTKGAISAETVEVKQLEDCSGEEKSKGTYFESKKLSTGSDWYQYQYTVAAENFLQEGQYNIQIDSKDKAGNHTSNVSNKHSDSNLEILFAVDQTAPSAVVSGTENGGVYKEEKRTVMLDVQDNLALSDVTVYLNGDKYATYDAKQISEMEDGLIPVVVEESFATQTIQLRATDMAGNVLGEKVDGEYDKTFEDFELIVTQNIFAQMLHTYWLFIILGILAVTGIIIFVVVRRKKKENE